MIRVQLTLMVTSSVKGEAELAELVKEISVTDFCGVLGQGPCWRVGGGFNPISLERTDDGGRTWREVPLR